MTGKNKYIWLMAVTILFAGLYGIAPAADEDSLLAMEELTLTDSVEGDLPASDAGEDDLLAELLAGDLDEDLPEEEIPLDALTIDESDNELGALLEDVADEDMAATIDGIDAEVPAENIVVDDVDLGAAIDDLGLDSLETETLDIAEEEPEAIAEDTDVVVEEPEAIAEEPEVIAEDDFSMDDLLGELTAEEPTADTLPVVAEEELVPAVEEVAVVEEKGLDVEEEIPEIDDSETDDSMDMDELIDELAGDAEADLDLGGLVVEEPAPVKATESIVVELPEIVKEPVAVELVDIVEEPEEYIDDLALDDDLFKELANEAQGDIATEKSAIAVARGEAPSPIVVEQEFEVDDLIETLAEEAEAGVVPASGLEETVSVVVAEPVAIVEEPVAIVEEPVAIVEEPVAIVEAPVTIAKEPVAIVAEPLVVKRPEVAAFETAERLKRIAAESHAIESIKNAERMLAKKDYVKSIILFEEALKYLPRRNNLIPMRERAHRGIAGASYLRALSLERMGELENAKAAALDSVKYGYKKGEETVRRIQSTIDKPPVVPPPPKTERWNQPSYIKTQKEIKSWLKRGREAYLTGEYKLAILNFESVLARDPENKEAMRLRTSASQKLYDRTSAELEGTRINMMNQVRTSWSPRRKYGEYESPIDSKGPDGGVISRGDEDEKRITVIKKMKNIRIPEIDFRQANIRDVVDFLHAQSVEFDPADNPEERTGVNFILKIGSDKADAAPTSAPDPWGGLDDGAGLDAGGSDGSGEVLVTFSALDMTLEDALKVVVEYANLKYIIRGNLVKIMPSNWATGEIEHRMYDVLSSAISRFEELSTAVSSNNRGGGGGDFQAIEGGDLGGGDEVDLKALFAEMGVQWPKDSSIKYVPGLGKLVVANTLENLTVFEKVLKVLNVVPYQIEIEARFVEVAQTDIDSLGLEWLLNDNWEVAEKKSSAGLPLSARERIIVEKNASGGGITRGNRFLTQANFEGQSIADDLLRFTSVLTNPELSVVLHAIQQKGHSDLLSAPKVTTISGQSATIKVVTEYIYPTEYTLIEAQGSGGDNAGIAPPAVEPGSFETREVGVILEVLAEVSPSGQMINLTLSPEVVTEPIWKDYGYDYFLGNMGGAAVSTHLRMEQPFFHSRSLQTNLLVYNGATVAMGGMITEVRTDVDDKIPILGDIPIIGRLFRSRYESSEKRNLIIFVTARLVDPSGRALDSERFGIDASIAENLSTPAEASE